MFNLQVVVVVVGTEVQVVLKVSAGIVLHNVKHMFQGLPGL